MKAEENHIHWESCYAVTTKRLKYSFIWFLQFVAVVNSIEFLLQSIVETALIGIAKKIIFF
jgi:hypothetical protein